MLVQCASALDEDRHEEGGVSDKALGRNACEHQADAFAAAPLRCRWWWMDDAKDLQSKAIVAWLGKARSKFQP